MGASQYYCAASLDGFIAESDDTLEWLIGYQGSYEATGVDPRPNDYEAFYGDVGALVSGSATYQFVLDHFRGEQWPYEGKPWWVLSSRDLPIPDGEGVDVRVVEADVAELYPEMAKAAGERNVWVVGGGNVASQFADAGLLDELLVTVVPVVLGAGKPLFDRRLPTTRSSSPAPPCSAAGWSSSATRSPYEASQRDPRGGPGPVGEAERRAPGPREQSLARARARRRQVRCRQDLALAQSARRHEDRTACRGPAHGR